MIKRIFYTWFSPLGVTRSLGILLFLFTPYIVDSSWILQYSILCRVCFLSTHQSSNPPVCLSITYWSGERSNCCVKSQYALFNDYSCPWINITVISQSETQQYFMLFPTVACFVVYFTFSVCYKPLKSPLPLTMSSPSKSFDLIFFYRFTWRK